MIKQKIPVLKTCLQALLLVANNYKKLLKVSLPLIILLLALLVAKYLLGYTQIDFTDNSLNFGIDFNEGNITRIFTILHYLTIVMAVVACHRVFITGANYTFKKIFNGSGNEIRYIGWFLVTCLYAFIPMTIVAVIIFIFIAPNLEATQIDGLSIYVIYLYILFTLFFLARMFLILPAAAIGLRDKNISWSWRITRGNGWRLTIIALLFPAVISFMLAMLPIYDSIIYDIFITLICLSVGAIEVALLSCSYMFFGANDTQEK